MNGVHDLGGMHGFGPVEREPGPPVLERWEAAMIAIQGAGERAGLYNIDEFRHGIERMEPVHYLASSYFEHWLDGTARVLDEKGSVSAAELDERASRPGHAEVHAPVVLAPPVQGSVRRELRSLPSFFVGERVITNSASPEGHTRLARYARGKQGVVHRVHGAYVFPDSNAHGLGEDPRYLYSVRFDARELWGTSAEPRSSVFIDLWEPYLRLVERS